MRRSLVSDTRNFVDCLLTMFKINADTVPKVFNIPYGKIVEPMYVSSCSTETPEGGTKCDVVYSSRVENLRLVPEVSLLPTAEELLSNDGDDAASESNP